MGVQQYLLGRIGYMPNGYHFVTSVGFSTFIPPLGYTELNMIVVGSGGGGGGGTTRTSWRYGPRTGGAGGGAGGISGVKIPLTRDGVTLKCVVGYRGAGGNAIDPGWNQTRPDAMDGLSSYVQLVPSGVVLCSAEGGKGGQGTVPYGDFGYLPNFYGGAGFGAWTVSPATPPAAGGAGGTAAANSTIATQLFTPITGDAGLPSYYAVATRAPGTWPLQANGGGGDGAAGWNIDAINHTYAASIRGAGGVGNDGGVIDFVEDTFPITGNMMNSNTGHYGIASAAPLSSPGWGGGGGGGGKDYEDWGSSGAAKLDGKRGNDGVIFFWW